MAHHLTEAYYKAIAAGQPVEGGTIPRSFGGPSQTANDIALADPDNVVDVDTIAEVYFGNDFGAALRAINLLRSAEAARDGYALARNAGAPVGPKNPFFSTLDDRAKVEEYQIAAGVARTALNLGITVEDAEVIYTNAVTADPNVQPTDMS